MIATLQTVSIMVDKKSDLFQLLQYFEPNNYLDSSLILMIGLALFLAFAALIALKFLADFKISSSARSTLMTGLVGTILMHLQVIFESIVIVPLLKAGLLIIKIPPN